MKAEKLLVRNAFARAAPHYDAVADFQRETGERLMAECRLGRAPTLAPARVLDAGCGTGHGLQLIAQRWPAAQITALDFAAPMLRHLPAAVRQRAVCADIERLPLADASVDLVWSSLVLQWCDAGRVAREIWRVLSGNGHFAASTLGPATFVELRRAFVGVDAFRHTNEFIDEMTLRQALTVAGFTVTTLYRVETTTHFPDLAALLASLRQLGANHVVAKNRRAGMMGKRAWQRFADNYERMRTTHGLPLTYENYFFLAHRNDMR